MSFDQFPKKRLVGESDIDAIELLSFAADLIALVPADDCVDVKDVLLEFGSFDALLACPLEVLRGRSNLPTGMIRAVKLLHAFRSDNRSRSAIVSAVQPFGKAARTRRSSKSSRSLSARQ